MRRPKLEERRKDRELGGEERDGNERKKDRKARKKSKKKM